MRRWFVLLALLGATWPAIAAKTRTLSVAQMEQLLATLRGKPDGKVAGALDNLRLTERVSATRLTRWETEFPGIRSRQELVKLADLSAFLDPPASDVASNPRPDVETQKHILGIAVQYVATTITRLPDFFATRETSHFEAGPVPIAAKTADSTVGLLWTGVYSQTVTYRQGQEVSFEAKDGQEKYRPLGLTSDGEFGPILLQVFRDALTGHIGFARWEQTPAGLAAVFAYATPENNSHFEVVTIVSGQVRSLRPAYRGEIEIDPATGAILRLSEIAQMAPPHQEEQAAIEVEYAPVMIGDRSYVCPVKGVAFSKIGASLAGQAEINMRQLAEPISSDTQTIQTLLNDVAFTQYHEFRSRARIVPAPNGDNGEKASGGNGETSPESLAGNSEPGWTSVPAAAPPVPAASASAVNPPAKSAPAINTGVPPAPATNPTAGLAAATATMPAIPTPTVTTPSTSTANPETESAESAARPASATANPPGAPAAQAETEPALRVSSRLVVVDVVARKGDQPISGLEQSDFAVSEDGVPQNIRYFTPHFEAATASPAAAELPSLPADTWTNLPITSAADSATVLLLDGLNTPPGDLAYARREMIKYLKAGPPGRRIAVFALGHRLQMLQGFTTETNQLLATLQKADATSPTTLLPPDEQRMDEARELAEMRELPGLPARTIMDTNNWMAESDAAQTTLRVNMTLEAMQQLSRYLSGIEGRKNLVWFSGSFPSQLTLKFIDISGNANTRPAADFNEQLKQTTALLTAARVAVYPVDVRGVIAQPMFSAAQATSPTTTKVVDFTATSGASPSSKASSALANGGPQGGTFGSDLILSPKQRAAEHATMDDLAQQTGGRAEYESNDLDRAMADAFNDGSNYYTLAYVPTNSNYNGAERKIQIRLTHEKGDLFYRRSYYAVSGPPSEKQAEQASRSVFLASMLRGVPASSQIAFNVHVAVPDPAPPSGPVAGANPAMKNRTARYAIDFAFNASAVDLAEGVNGQRHGRLAVVAIAYDEDGNRLNWVESDLPLVFDQAAWERVSRSGLQVHQDLDLPSGQVYLRVGLYNPDSGRFGSMEIPLKVTAAK